MGHFTLIFTYLSLVISFCSYCSMVPKLINLIQKYANWLADWLTDWLIWTNRWFDWLIDWLIFYSPNEVLEAHFKIFQFLFVQKFNCLISSFKWFEQLRVKLKCKKRKKIFVLPKYIVLRVVQKKKPGLCDNLRRWAVIGGGGGCPCNF